MFRSHVAQRIAHDLNQGGLRDGCIGVHKFGINPAVSTSDEMIWQNGGVYVYPTVATTMKISSSNVNDTSAGSGAQTAKVIGLDGDYNVISEEVTLNGQTGVTLANQYLRLSLVYAKSVGSGLTNAGDIYVGVGDITAGVPDTVYSKAGAGLGQTQLCSYTIPAGYYGYVYNWGASCGAGKAAVITLYAQWYVDGAYESWRSISNLRFNNAVTERDIDFPDRLPPKTDIEVRASIDTGTTGVEAHMEVLLIPTTANPKWGQIN